MVFPDTLAAVEVGSYVNVFKALAAVAVILIWARLLTWIDKDAERAHLPRVGINCGMIAGFILGVLCFFMLPGFGVAIAVLAFFFAVDIGVYLLLRNQKVGVKDLGDELRAFLRAPFDKLRRDPSKVDAGPGEVVLFNSKGAPVMQPDDESPDLPGFKALQKLLAGPLKTGAEQVDLIAADQATQVKYTVDGVGYNGTPLDRAAGAAAVMFAKSLANLDVGDKRRPQTGNLKVQVDGAKRELQITSAGSKAGESMRIVVDPKGRHDVKFESLGFSDDQLGVIDGMVRGGEGGLVIVSTPKGQGLTTLLYGLVRAHDAFLTNIATVERENLLDMEGITQNILPAGTGTAEEVKTVEWVVSQEPDVIMVPQVENPRSAVALIQHAARGKRVYVGVRASSTFDAINQWKKLVGDEKSAIKHLKMVINGRVARRLCQACKVSYTPDPETLRKMNMSPDKVGKLYQARTKPMLDQRGNPVICNFCNDLRFKGRIGVFEIFNVDDEVKNVLLAGGSGSQLKALFRKQRAKYLQEQALLVVEQGETSVQEALRVLRIGETPAPAKVAT